MTHEKLKHNVILLVRLSVRLAKIIFFKKHWTEQPVTDDVLLQSIHLIPDSDVRNPLQQVCMSQLQLVCFQVSKTCYS